MASELLLPSAISSSANYTSPVNSDIDEGCDKPDANWLVWDGNGNTDLLVDFATPANTPPTGADKMIFRAVIRNDAAGSNSTSWSLELWERIGGTPTQVSVLATGNDPSESGELVSGKWNASSLTTSDGSEVMLKLIQTGGGSGGPSNRKGIEVGAVDWQMELAAETPATRTAMAPDGRVYTVSVQDETYMTPSGAVINGATTDAGQDFTVTAITENETLGTITFDPGAVDLAITAVTENETLGTVTFDQGQEFVVTAITENETLGTVTFDPGAVDLTLTAINENETLGTVSFDPGAVDLAITAINEDETLGIITLDPGAVDLAITAINEDETLGTVTFLQGLNIVIDPITENETLGIVALDPGAVELTLSTINENETLGTVTFTLGAVDLTISAITENETLGIVTLDPGAVELTLSTINETETLGAVTFNLGSGATTITVAGITGGANLSTLSYVVFDGADIGVASVIKQGNDETTDANGDLVIDLTGLGVTVGETLTIVITNYTTTPTAANRGAVCYADAA